MGTVELPEDPTEDPSEDAARDRFAAELLDALLALDVVVEARYVPGEFRIDYLSKGADKPAQVFLGNTYAECEGATAEDRAIRIAKLASIAALPALPDTWAGVRPLLRAVLRQATFGQGFSAGREPLARPAMPMLAELVVVDHATAMRYVTVEEPEKWGVTVDEVFAAGRENLEAAAFGIVEKGEPAAKPAAFRLIEGGDDYFSSMPLLPGWLAAMRRVVGGPPLAFVPEHSGLLLVGRSADGGALVPLIKMVADEFAEGVRRTSPVPYTVDDAGAVVPFEVPRDHPAWLELRRARVLLEADVYGHQLTQLREQYTRSGADVHVAELVHTTARSDGRAFTIAHWIDGAACSLPHADYVGLGGRDDGFLVPFDTVSAELGLTPEPGQYPPRYRVGPWPGSETMARLRLASQHPDTSAA
jgi:hypothetical protein